MLLLPDISLLQVVFIDGLYVLKKLTDFFYYF